jgi:hypothetical protein
MILLRTSSAVISGLAVNDEHFLGNTPANAIDFSRSITSAPINFPDMTKRFNIPQSGKFLRPTKRHQLASRATHP